MNRVAAGGADGLRRSTAGSGNTLPRSYADEQQGETIARLRRVVLLPLVPLALGAAAHLLVSGHWHPQLLTSLAVQAGVCVAIWALVHGRWAQRRAIPLAVGFTVTLITAGLWSLSVSPQHLPILVGTIAVTMTAGAMIFPWGAGAQMFVSTAAALSATLLLQPVIDLPSLTRILTVLGVGALFSTIGAFLLERQRRATFVQQKRTRMRAQQQAAVAYLGQQALAVADVGVLMDDVVSLVARTLELEYSEILQLVPDATAFHLQAGAGWAADSVRQARLAVGNASHAGYTLRSQELVTIHDLRMETRFAVPAVLRDHGVISGMTVPISAPKRLFGVLGVYATASRAFSSDDGNFLRSVANVVVSAIERKETEEALELAKSTAEAADRAKSELLANASHELRTPMNIIFGMTDMLLDSPLSSEQHQWAEAVRRNAAGLLSLIDNLLDFSKIEAGCLSLEAIPFDPREHLLETLQLLSPLASTKSLRLASGVAADVPSKLSGDSHRLRQVLTNLVANAVKFTEQGQIVVHVAVDSTTTKDVALHFSVADTGIGIPAAKQGAIFQAFVQADGSMTRRYGGTGLGLAISSRLVEAMGGRIWVESEVDKGSTFHFTARFATEQEGRQPLHQSWLLTQVSEDPERLLDLVAMFRDETARLLDECRGGLAQRDSKKVEHAAHRLASSLGRLGASAALEVALRLETAGHADDLGQAQSTLSTVERELTRLDFELTMRTSAVTGGS